MVLKGERCTLRPHRSDDAEAICAAADDYMVARWMTRAFPHPYTIADAGRWIEIATANGRGRFYAIEVDGALAGGIGVQPYVAERGGSAAFGYWLGRAHWGRGIATDAARTLSDDALARGGLRRLEARVFAQNVASARVLEKCGFRFEARLKAYYIDRENQICDALLFARLA